MLQDVIIAGYQGPRSILTRGLTAFAKACLPEAKMIADVTAEGMPAQDLFAGLQDGTFQIGYMASGYLAGQVPELGVLDIPFSVRNREDAYRRLDGAAGAHLSRAVRDAAGLVVLAYWDNGFRHLTNGHHPLRNPDDCVGMKVRTLNNQMYQDVMAAMGFEPVVTDVKELISACESGRVQAQENPLTNMLTFGLDRWHKHVSLTGHIFGVVLLVAHGRWFEGLDGAQQEAIFAAAKEATCLQRQLAQREDDDGLQTLAERGVRVLSPDEIDLEAFQAALADLRNAALSKLPQDLVDHYIGQSH